MRLRVHPGDTTKNNAGDDKINCRRSKSPELM